MSMETFQMYFNLYFQRIVALTVSNQTGFTFLLFNTVNRDIKHCGYSLRRCRGRTPSSSASGWFLRPGWPSQCGKHRWGLMCAGGGGLLGRSHCRPPSQNLPLARPSTASSQTLSPYCNQKQSSLGSVCTDPSSHLVLSSFSIYTIK